MGRKLKRMNSNRRVVDEPKKGSRAAGKSGEEKGIGHD